MSETGWTGKAKIATLVSCLREKARVILESIQVLENLSYDELKSMLEWGRYLCLIDRAPGCSRISCWARSVGPVTSPKSSSCIMNSRRRLSSSEVRLVNPSVAAEVGVFLSVTSSGGVGSACPTFAQKSMPRKKELPSVSITRNECQMRRPVISMGNRTRPGSVMACRPLANWTTPSSGCSAKFNVWAVCVVRWLKEAFDPISIKASKTRRRIRMVTCGWGVNLTERGSGRGLSVVRFPARDNSRGYIIFPALRAELLLCAAAHNVLSKTSLLFALPATLRAAVHSGGGGDRRIAGEWPAGTVFWCFCLRTRLLLVRGYVLCTRRGGECVTGNPGAYFGRVVLPILLPCIPRPDA